MSAMAAGPVAAPSRPDAVRMTMRAPALHATADRPVKTTKSDMPIR